MDNGGIFGIDLRSLHPGDPKLVENIINQLKSQGIFDNFRRECLADVDTKPAYQNLKGRVERHVSSFLDGQTWRPDLNKNQLRESLRRQVHDSNMLHMGADRIVEQVVNPKIRGIFQPEIERVIHKLMGIDELTKKYEDPFDKLLQSKALKCEEDLAECKSEMEGKESEEPEQSEGSSEPNKLECGQESPEAPCDYSPVGSPAQSSELPPSNQVTNEELDNIESVLAAMEGSPSPKKTADSPRIHANTVELLLRDTKDIADSPRARAVMAEDIKNELRDKIMDYSRVRQLKVEQVYTDSSSQDSPVFDKKRTLTSDSSVASSPARSPRKRAPTDWDSDSGTDDRVVKRRRIKEIFSSSDEDEDAREVLGRDNVKEKVLEHTATSSSDSSQNHQTSYEEDGEDDEVTGDRDGQIESNSRKGTAVMRDSIRNTSDEEEQNKIDVIKQQSIVTDSSTQSSSDESNKGSADGVEKGTKQNSDQKMPGTSSNGNSDSDSNVKLLKKMESPPEVVATHSDDLPSEPDESNDSAAEAETKSGDEGGKPEYEFSDSDLSESEFSGFGTPDKLAKRAVVGFQDGHEKDVTSSGSDEFRALKKDLVCSELARDVDAVKKVTGSLNLAALVSTSPVASLSPAAGAPPSFFSRKLSARFIAKFQDEQRQESEGGRLYRARSMSGQGTGDESDRGRVLRSRSNSGDVETAFEPLESSTCTRPKRKRSDARSLDLDTALQSDTVVSTVPKTRRLSERLGATEPVVDSVQRSSHAEFSATIGHSPHPEPEGRRQSSKRSSQKRRWRYRK